MARLNVDDPSEFRSADMLATGIIRSGFPKAGLTTTTRLLSGYLVEDDTVTTTFIQNATAQSVTVRGVLLISEEIIPGTTTLDENRKLPYKAHGLCRCKGLNAISRHDRLVSAGAGRVRTFNAITDTANMVVGTALCDTTVTDDDVDMFVDVATHGAA